MDDEERDVLPTGEGKDVGPGELWLRTSFPSSFVLCILYLK